MKEGLLSRKLRQQWRWRIRRRCNNCCSRLLRCCRPSRLQILCGNARCLLIEEKYVGVQLFMCASCLSHILLYRNRDAHSCGAIYACVLFKPYTYVSKWNARSCGGMCVCFSFKPMYVRMYRNRHKLSSRCMFLLWSLMMRAEKCMCMSPRAFAKRMYRRKCARIYTATCKIRGNIGTAMNVFEVVKPTRNVRGKIRDSHLLCKSLCKSQYACILYMYIYTIYVYICDLRNKWEFSTVICTSLLLKFRRSVPHLFCKSQ